MEEIRATALAFYEAGSVELKQAAIAVFNSMDVDKDGKISISEFADFLKRNNYHHKQDLFQEIDRDHNGYLDFWEVVVFFYITRTRNIWCDGCKSFIKGTYFICTYCFHNTTQGYDLCCACYGSQKYQSGHGPFFDNYSMLTELRSLIRSKQLQPQQLQPQPQPQPQQLQPQQLRPQQQSQATSREIKKDNGGHEELKKFFEILTLEMKAATAMVNLENASGCSIM